MRWTRSLLPMLLVLLLAACGGSGGASQADDGGNGGNGGNGGESQPAETPEPAQSEDDGGNGGNGGTASGDVEQLADNLVPPNSEQTSRTTAEGTIWTTYTSTDSPDSLVSYYEGKIADAGMHVYSTTSAQGTTSWLFAESDDGSGFGGSVTVGPPGDDSGGSSVIVLVTNGS